MMKEVYTPEQMVNADRLAKVIANIPESKKAMFRMMMEALILGAEMAESLTFPTSSGATTINGPSA